MEFEESGEKLDGLQFDCLKLSPGASADCFGTASCIRIIPNALKSALLTVQFAQPDQVDDDDDDDCDDDSVRTMDNNNVDIQKRIFINRFEF